MSAVVHVTPGLLDIRSITVMGLSAKPRSGNPIGMFGTGLKYAIATLCRHGCSPVLWIGQDKYTFVGREDRFRGQPFMKIRARLEKPSWARARYIDLPFTTEYGRFWRPWMAFREIEANTRDEGGETYHDTAPVDRIIGRDGATVIVVDLPEYVHAYMLKDETFLPGGRALLDPGGPPVEALEVGPRDKLYWRGLRVVDLDKPTVRTWNFICPLELTEDRTLKHLFMARAALARWLASECDDARLIEDVITADGRHWEHRLEFEYHAGQPSPLFLDVYQRCKSRAVGLASYASRWLPTPPGQTPWERHPRPWRLDDESEPTALVDANGLVVMQRPHEPPIEWGQLARAALASINGQGAVPRAAEEEAIPF